MVNIPLLYRSGLMEIKEIKDYEKYVFKNNIGWEWICEVRGARIYYKLITILGSSPSSHNRWVYWYDFAPYRLERANELICRIREEALEGYNPIYRKIKAMEQRFQERMKYA